MLVVPGMLFFVIPLGLQIYDDHHRIAISCVVRTATAGSQSSGSWKGEGGSGPQVVVETDRCGKILLQDGVNVFNVDAVATELRRAGEVRSSVGAASYDSRGTLAAFGLSPTAYPYENG